MIDQRLQRVGVKIFNQGSYDGDGHTYGRIRFFFGKENYALMEVINEKGETVLSYRLDAK